MSLMTFGVLLQHQAKMKMAKEEESADEAAADDIKSSTQADEKLGKQGEEQEASSAEIEASEGSLKAEPITSKMVSFDQDQENVSSAWLPFIINIDPGDFGNGLF